MDWKKDKIPLKIDFVEKHGNLKIIKYKFDFFYSSHNLEHQIDLIEHLNQANDALNSNGKYLIFIPDKRYCFDYFKAESTLADVLYSHYLNSNKHTLLAFLKDCIRTHNEPQLHLSGNHGRPLFERNEISDLECYQSKMNEFYYQNGSKLILPECLRPAK